MTRTPLKIRGKDITKQYWPLVLTLGILWTILLTILIQSLGLNQGHLIYALDDPYIHLAVAKNFAQYGVWGVTRYEFTTSATSSPLWTFLLSMIYRLFGVNEVAPLVLNFVFGTLIIFEVYFLLRKYFAQPFQIFILLLSLIFFTPMSSLVFTGMEHTMHIFFAILYVYFVSKILTGKSNSIKDYTLSLVLANTITAIRYEGLFLIFVTSILYFLRKEILKSLILIVIGALPIIIYGTISVLNGGYFLPSSVFLKANTPSLSPNRVIVFLYTFAFQLARPHILVLVSVALFVLNLQLDRYKTLWKDSTIMLEIFVGTTLLHLLIARVDHFYRYEAYLVALGIIVIAIGLREYLPTEISIRLDKRLIPKYISFLTLLVVIISPLAGRGIIATIQTPQATNNIYEQQYQMGLFLKQFYQGEGVAANDIGAINFLADIKCLDIWGLGSIEVARAMMNGNYNTERIYELTKGKNIKIAVVYDYVLERYGGAPPQWIKVGEWTITNNVVCGGDTVSFYAVDPREENRLIESLRAFSWQLPKDVIQKGKYINSKEEVNVCKGPE